MELPLNVTVRGAGPTVIFAHGVGTDQSLWHAIAASFEDQFKTVLFDWVGSSNSALSAFEPECYTCLDDYANDLPNLIDKLGGTPVTFVGYGVGGLIGLLASNARPAQFASQILVATSPCYISDAGYQGGFTHADIEQTLTLLGDDWDRRHRLDMAAGRAAGSANGLSRPTFQRDVVLHFARLCFLADRRADLACSRTRTLIIQGDYDLLVPTSVGEFMHRAIPGSALQIVPQSGRLLKLNAKGTIARHIARHIRDSLTQPPASGSN